MLAMADKVEFYLDLAQRGDLGLDGLLSLPSPERFELSTKRLCISLSSKLKDLLEKERVKSCNLEERGDLKCIHSSCEVAYRSGIHLLVRVGDNQWLKTRITLKNPELALSSESCVSVQSNVLPCEAIWERLGVKRGRTTEYYPWSELRKEASDKSLPRVIRDRRAKKIKCQLAKELQRKCEGCHPSQKLIKIQPQELKLLKNIVNNASTSDGEATVAKYAWCQGVFARKFFRTEQQFDHEAAIVQRVSHPNVVHTFGSTSSNGKFSVLMEFLEEDLQRWSHNKYGDRLVPPSDALNMLLQIAEAMKYLHQEKVVHGDLKPQNILLSEVPISGDFVYVVVKVADFGDAKVVDYRTESNFRPSKGTTVWAAPEVLRCRDGQDSFLSHPFKIDVYSFGLIAYQLLTACEPFANIRPFWRLKREIVANNLSLSKEFKEHKEDLNYPKEFISMLEECWDHDPSKRPSFSDICVKITNAKRSVASCSSRIFCW